MSIIKQTLRNLSIAIVGILIANSAFAKDNADKQIVQIENDCVLTKAGNIYCWGNNYYSQAGYDNKENQYKNGFINQVFLGGSNPNADHTYYKLLGFKDGKPTIEKYKERVNWDEMRDLAKNNTPLVTINHNADTAFYPNEIQKPKGEYFTKIMHSGLTKCATTNTNTLYCWGYGSHGVLGNGKITNSPIPQKVLIDDTIIKVDNPTIESMYALTKDGDIYVWGENQEYGKKTIAHPKPTKFSSNVKFKEVYRISWANRLDSLAMGVDNKLYKLDINLKNASIVASEVMFPNKDTTIKKVVANGNFVCALDSRSKLYCWGWGYSYGFGAKDIETPKVAFNGIKDVLIIPYFNKNNKGPSGGICVEPTLSSGIMCFGDGTPTKKRVANNNVNILGANTISNIAEYNAGICFIANYKNSKNAVLCMDEGFNDIKKVIEDVKFYNDSCAVTNDDKLFCWGGTSDGLGSYGYGISKITKYIDGGVVTAGFTTTIPTQVIIPPKPQKAKLN